MTHDAGADERGRFRGCLLGLACGDAVGTTVEFKARGRFTPVTDMVGGGVFDLPAGSWTDDTSMALCLASSLVELGLFDPADQMRPLLAMGSRGLPRSTGRCFDVGNTVYDALGSSSRRASRSAGPPTLGPPATAAS